MSFIGGFEFKRYMYAEERLRKLEEEHALAIQRAYADIHPTRMGYNFNLGKVYSESVNVADYAIWLVETKELQAKQRRFWQHRAFAFSKAVEQLDKEQRRLVWEAKVVPELLTANHHRAMDAARRELATLVDSDPELQGPEPVEAEESDEELEKAL